MRKIINAIKLAWQEKQYGEYPALAPKMSFIDFLKAIRYYYRCETLNKSGRAFYPAYYRMKKNKLK